MATNSCLRIEIHVLCISLTIKLAKDRCEHTEILFISLNKLATDSYLVIEILCISFTIIWATNSRFRIQIHVLCISLTIKLAICVLQIIFK